MLKKSIAKPKKIILKLCKICGKNKRYANLSKCWKCFKSDQIKKREESAKRKLERKKSTKKYQESITKKTTKENDKIYQEIGKLMYNKCFFNNIDCSEYSTLHHYVRKSQSLWMRWNIRNGIPVCAHCHCLIHNAEDAVREGIIVERMGKEWFNFIKENRHIVVIEKNAFVLKENERLKKELYELQTIPRIKIKKSENDNSGIYS